MVDSAWSKYMLSLQPNLSFWTPFKPAAKKSTSTDTTALTAHWRCSSWQPFLDNDYAPACSHSCMTTEAVTANPVICWPHDQLSEANVNIPPINQGLNEPRHHSFCLYNQCVHIFDCLQLCLWHVWQPCSQLPASDSDQRHQPKCQHYLDYYQHSEAMLTYPWLTKDWINQDLNHTPFATYWVYIFDWLQLHQDYLDLQDLLQLRT